MILACDILITSAVVTFGATLIDFCHFFLH